MVLFVLEVMSFVTQKRTLEQPEGKDSPEVVLEGVNALSRIIGSAKLEVSAVGPRPRCLRLSA